ncbi:hypothetical protein [Sphingomonas psychrotolerans]|uniref:Uncharacterized protein n=1 Tax=Sphingomonas psychrotolerans TaxID=1327635 RepID=A0A2K8MEX4_9SPHN|nr:hypothetical protein [Sphingomonas psychrotolerans]ATY32440.1 hypothetical protein CVN68_11005 [Sphingomonas psychrotolerans]
MKAMAQATLLALCAILAPWAAAQNDPPVVHDFAGAVSVVCPSALNSEGAWMRDPVHLSATGFTLKSDTDHILMAESKGIRVVFRVQEQICIISDAYDSEQFQRDWKWLAHSLHPNVDVGKMLAQMAWRPRPVLTPFRGHKYLTYVGVTKSGGRPLPQLYITPFKD